ncbi:exodeoxyribonuclease V alpha subunit [Amphibacillus marinus]|uniref:ATP-dependent RecD2 DNA helicase n=1 Tax=Amphibacillus marinus TaxID=872970 RepID=A0A1H8NX22_9BACI|nr:ATP-dependent RecD-like DNA helicase [Amphibacillus marinus]SEO34210.1 exodeoxyribonuclease V alpha subunit [Amphibacillus marinus]
MGEMLQNVEEPYVKGELIYTIYTNEQEHFSIAKVKVLETNEPYQEPDLVVKGYFSELIAGETYVFQGEFVNHKRFGLQYEVHSYRRYVPDTMEGLIAYLSSNLFQGIGKKTADRIVTKLGETAISKILKDPGVLDSIQGLTKERKEALIASLREHQGFDHVVVQLSKYGIGLRMAQKIYQFYQEQAIEVLNDNPYQYVFDIEGFGFQRADSIALQNKLALDHPARIRAGCIYCLHEAMSEGHVYLPKQVLVNDVALLLDAKKHNIDKGLIDRQQVEMAEESMLVIKDDRVFLPVLYFAESGFTTQLKRIKSAEHDFELVEAELLKAVGQTEEEEVISYGKDQYQAIKLALSEKIMILTGGPGTGKTTVIKGILKAFSTLNDLSLDLADYDSKAKFPYILTAPTGRAAKRITESTGLPASTIHRLLGWDGHEGFEKNKENQLSGRLIVIDEFSMVDIFLANQLFKAIPDEMQVLLVGDEDQLPSVGPGQVLGDLLASEKISAIMLDEVYRQKEGSKIIQLAHQIKHDRVDETVLTKATDFNFIKCQKPVILDALKQIVEKAINKGFDIMDMQVLAPMYRTDIGIHRINEEIQRIVNPKRRDVREMRTKDVIFRTGDKVIQLVNQPEDGVFNGDIGQITAIFKETENVEQEEQLVVTYDETDVVYNRKDLLNIMHAYCISIHKSQGSEFPIIIMPVDMSFRRMLKKKLLYTAITRAKKSLIICGNQSAFVEGVKQRDTHVRYTTLAERLVKVFEDDTYANQLEAEIEDEENLSPFDFM